MNSLVVLLSVVAMAAAKPSHFVDAGVISYSAPIVSTGAAAISHQARLDIKSSPAFVETAAFAPFATRAVIAEPRLVAAPAYVAPAAVSSQSRLDIKTTPSITKTVITAAPLAYSAPIATSAISSAFLNTEFIAPAINAAAIAPTFLKNFAPAIAASPIIKSASFVPAAIEAAPLSFGAPEIAASHVLKKRSAPIISADPILTYASPTLVSTYSASPLAYSTPINVRSPFFTKTYNLHAW